jgi:hypothetical protein
MTAHLPLGVTATVDGSTITVTFAANSIRFLPPSLTCATTSLGPLPVGHYAVEINPVQPGTQPTTSLVATNAIDLTAAFAAAANVDSDTSPVVNAAPHRLSMSKRTCALEMSFFS